MNDPLRTLIELNAQTRDLDMVQSWVTAARISYPKNQRIQQALERRQDDIDARRALIALTMLDISSRN
jgi:hypothetical protein